MKSVQAQMVSSWVGTRQRRILAVGYATGRYGRTRVPSPRQLPTNHDHDGESLHSIHEYQSDQPSTTATPAAVHLRLTEKPPPRPDHHHLKGRSISAYRKPRAAASGPLFRLRDRQVMADQRPIGCSKPAVPFETDEFNDVGLVGDLEGAMSTRSCRMPAVASEQVKSLDC